jgi:hypothetical protein
MTPLIVEIRVYSGSRIELVDYEGKVQSYSDVHDYEFHHPDGSGFPYVIIYWGRIVVDTKRYLSVDYSVWHDGCIVIELES